MRTASNGGLELQNQETVAGMCLVQADKIAVLPATRLHSVMGAPSGTRKMVAAIHADTLVNGRSSRVLKSVVTHSVTQPFCEASVITAEGAGKCLGLIGSWPECRSVAAPWWSVASVVTEAAPAATPSGREEPFLPQNK